MMIYRDVNNHQWVINYDGKEVSVDFKKDIDRIIDELTIDRRNRKINQILDEEEKEEHHKDNKEEENG